ncbi:hypothetical protein [Aliiglaciecola sp. M165]|uniref:hypothetical protein n=1 Tax=Aliiglaciecola sp. M165 TaxID=2593649 RepID=UPI00117E5237|nr:hypothetical protein [Aliiglaciecola sp. M165]TRY30327.1 hypothetical protein FM019_16075 [Aliiglaciecola sp. M165]
MNTQSQVVSFKEEGFINLQKMIDGNADDSIFGQMTSSGPSKEKLNQVFMKQNVYGERLDIIHEVCSKHIDEVHLQNDLLDRHRLSPAGWTLEYRPLSQDNFYAHASRIDNGDNNYEISYSLGIPAILLSIGIELDSESPISQYNMSSQNSINNWFPHIEKRVEVSEKTINLVLDACLLIYFHEVCHVIFGHCKYKENNNNEARALEMDADFNAGSMFGLCIRGFSEIGRKFESGVDTLERIVNAGFLAGVAFKALSSRSEIYHQPTTRVMSFYGGCISSLTHINELQDFESIQDGDDFYGDFITKSRKKLLASLRSSSLRYFAGTEEDFENDYKELMGTTAPLRDNLKDGVLSKLQVPVMRRT